MAGETEQAGLFLAQLRQLLKMRAVIQLLVRADTPGVVSQVHALTQLTVFGVLEHSLGGHVFTGHQPAGLPRIPRTSCQFVAYPLRYAAQLAVIDEIQAGPIDISAECFACSGNLCVQFSQPHLASSVEQGTAGAETVQVPAQGGTLVGIQIPADVAVSQARIQALQPGIGEFLFEPRYHPDVESHDGVAPAFIPGDQRVGCEQHCQQPGIQFVHRQDHVIPGRHGALVDENALDTLLMRQQHMLKGYLHIFNGDRRVIDGNIAFLQQWVVHGAIPCS
ncbi:hypothetical protein D9M71_419460 [compost metagenome]